MKKLLAIVISMAMLVAMMPMGVFAAGDDNCVAEIGDNHYETLADAVAAAGNGSVGNTIELLDNIKLTQKLTINKDITLDLNGKTLTVETENGIEVVGKLVVEDSKDNGKIEGHSISTPVLVKLQGTLTLKKGNIEGPYSGAAIYGDFTAAQSSDTYATINVEGGTIKGNQYGILLYGKNATLNIKEGKVQADAQGAICGYGAVTDKYNYGNTIINISGGEILCKEGYVIYHPQKGVLNITGGKIQGPGGIEIKSGEAKVGISGNPTIEATAEKTTHEKNGSGSSTSGYALALVANKAYAGGASALISGGNIKGEIISLVDDDDMEAFPLSITGGTFSDVSALDYLGDDANVTIQLKDSVTLDKPININSGKIILDLSGKSINVTKKTVTENEKPEYLRNGITVRGSADLTITGNGQITGPSNEDCKDLDSKALIEVQGTDAKLTVLNGKISAGGVNDCGMYGIYVYNGGNVVLGNTEAGPIIETWFAAIGENNTTSPANITVNNGTYAEKATPADSDWWAYFCAPIYASASGNVTINGGTFNGYYGISSRYKNVEQNITISGGTFNGSRNAIFVDNIIPNGSKEKEKSLSITGGIYSTSPAEEYVAAGYKVNQISENSYEVVKEYTGGGAVVPPAVDNVTNNPADKNTTADITPAVKDNKAETTVDAKTADKIVDKAVANKSTEVIVDATGNNTVASSEVAIPEKTVKELAEKTDANLVIKTDNGKVDLDKTALEADAAQAGADGTVKLVVETVKTDENICHVDLKLITSNGAVTDFKGGNVAVTINLTKELAVKELVCVYIDDNGIYTLVNGQKNADGTYTFTTGHFSEYAVMAKAEADKKIAEQLNTLIKEVNLKVRTSKTSKKNIKAVVSGDVKALTDAGYTVKYKFYRSEKKASKYEAKATKAGKTYINTAGKKGTKYYYKAKALVYDGDKLVGQTVLTQCKYGVRTWSK